MYFRHITPPLILTGLVLLDSLTAACAQTINLDRILFEAVPLQENQQTVTVPGETSSGKPARPAVTSAVAAVSDIESYKQRISRLVLEQGPFSPALAQEHFAIGRILQQAGEHEEAIKSFEEAEFIVRINQGLNTPDVFRYVEAQINSLQAIGDLVTTREKQHYLYYLYQKHYGPQSPELVPMLSSLGDWYIENFYQSIQKSTKVSINFGLTNNDASAANPGPQKATPRQMALMNLLSAKNHYSQAINNLVKSRRLDAPELPDIEMKLLETIFLTANRDGFLEDPGFYLDYKEVHTGSLVKRREDTGMSDSYFNGNAVFERLRLYTRTQPQASPLEMARIIIGQADWNLLYHLNSKALDYYREALLWLQQHDVPEQTIRQLLQPESPVKLPTFTALPHSRESFGLSTSKEIDYAGYIDLSFRISRYGRAYDIEIGEYSSGTERDIIRRLKKLLRNGPFRPSLDADSNRRQQLRYFYAYIPE